MTDKMKSFVKGILVGLAGKPLEFAPGKEPEAPIPDNCLAFASAEPFTIATANTEKNWDGTLYYSTDSDTWSEWDGTTTLASAKHDGEQRIYMRGVGNTYIVGNATGSLYRRWVVTGSNIRCSGNIETLLDHETVASGNHPTMAEGCYQYLFGRCAGLVTAPKLPAVVLTKNCYASMFCQTGLTIAPELPAMALEYGCYYDMFHTCASLVKPPKLPATALADRCYYRMFVNCTSLTEIPELSAVTMKEMCYMSMFSGCAGLKLSEIQTDEYQTAYRIPVSGTGTTFTNDAGLGALDDMFKNTGGTFTGTPKINTTYYTSNKVV